MISLQLRLESIKGYRNHGTKFKRGIRNLKCQRDLDNDARNLASIYSSTRPWQYEDAWYVSRCLRSRPLRRGGLWVDYQCARDARPQQRSGYGLAMPTPPGMPGSVRVGVLIGQVGHGRELEAQEGVPYSAL